ncbi:MAG TPA: hypothetical protein DCQ73_01000 [Spirochaetaceae bacterium]|nr:hypothetical protein [Spirochaetaceae bacterium]
MSWQLSDSRGERHNIFTTLPPRYPRFKGYFWGIRNAIRLKVNNAMLESINSGIQRIKKMACGFRNRDRFRKAILFHFGDLNFGF